MGNNDVIIGARLEEYREKINMTHEEFAVLLGVSCSQVRNYQKGRQPVPEKAIQKLANGNEMLESFLRGVPNITLADVELEEVKRGSVSFLQYYTTDELLAELKRRIEAP